MNLYKIDFDIGKVEYYVDSHFIQQYRFFSFYEVCELVFACHLPSDKLLLNVVTKEKIIPILDCYVDQLVDAFFKKDVDSEMSCLQLSGRLFAYQFIQDEVKRSLEKHGLRGQLLSFTTSEKDCHDTN